MALIFEVAAGIILAVLILSNFELFLELMLLAIKYGFLYGIPLLALIILLCIDKDNNLSKICGGIVVIWGFGLFYRYQNKKSNP